MRTEQSLQKSSAWHGKILVTAILAVAAVALPNPQARGAVITWQDVQTIATDTDVLKGSKGTVYAYYLNNNHSLVNPIVVNTVSFKPLFGAYGPDVASASSGDGNLTLTTSSGNLVNAAVVGAPTVGFSGSANYASILSGCIYGDGQPLVLTLGNLSPGTPYAVQLWAEDPRESYRYVQASSTDAGSGGSGVLIYDVPHVWGGVGQYVIGTFTANSTTQRIQLSTPYGDPYPAINALSLQDLTIPKKGTLFSFR